MNAELPKMPPIDQSRMLPYSAIRYVPGYPEEYVKEYARAFAQEATRQAMQLAENACARIESSEWEQYKGRAVDQVAEKAANPYIAGKSDGASDCFDAIRAITHESEKRQ